MALPQKGTRSITVDGTTYRWYIRHKPTYCQALGWTPLTIAIEQAAQSGAKLLVELLEAHPGNWLGVPQRSVTPATIAASVRAALTAGWLPAERGAPFHFSSNLDAGSVCRRQ